VKNFLRAAIVVASIAVSFLGLISGAHASQNSCILPNTGTVSGLALVNNANACNGSLLSLYSGASAPGSPTTGMFWYNSTTNYIQQFDGISWLNLWFVDATNHLTSMDIGGGIISQVITAAPTTDIGSIPQPLIAVNGTATIISLGSSAKIGSIHVVVFNGALTLTYNATSLILPGAANIVTQAGDTAVAIYLGASNWRVLVYTPATIPTKTTPTTSDLLLIQDAAASNTPKKSTISSLLSLIGGALGGANGLVVTNNAGTPNSIIDIIADAAVMTNAGAPFYASTVSLSVNTSTTGANGLDTGARGNSAWYNIFLISNGTTTAGLASISATAPTMPGGYTYFVRVGAMRTDGSGNFLRTRQLGNKTSYTTSLPTVTSGTLAFWTATAVATFVPPTATQIKTIVSMRNTGIANSSVAVAPNNVAYSTGGTDGACWISLASVNNYQSGLCEINLESTNIYYGSNAGGAASVAAYGWTDKVNAN
jgi:hypothetical protein